MHYDFIELSCRLFSNPTFCGGDQSEIFRSATFNYAGFWKGC